MFKAATGLTVLCCAICEVPKGLVGFRARALAVVQAQTLDYHRARASMWVGWQYSRVAA
jgi:hypothetical protein